MGESLWKQNGGFHCRLMSIDFSFKQSFINFQPDKFKSKEEILDAMISRMMGRLVEKAEAIAAQKNVPVLERLTMMMLA